ncbi:MAG: hypothetical protein RMK52_03685 [Chitinophagales bacterium]|nr:hypothetical protein [Chitinophagales bacterium]MDW8393329.1 hypothetical protein [Chitinophagales bacterium]
MPQVSLLQCRSGHRGSVYALAAGGEGEFFSAGSDGLLLGWQQHGQPRRVSSFPVQIFSLCYLSGANHLLAGSMHGEVFVADAQTGSLLHQLNLHTDSVFRIAHFQDRIYTVSKDGTVTVLSADGRYTELHRWKPGRQALRSLAAHSHCPLAIGGADGQILLFDRLTGQIRATLSGPQATVFCLTYDSEGQRLYAGSRDARLYVFNPFSGAVQQQINAHMFTINDLKLIYDDAWLVTASRDKSIRIWNTQNLELKLSLKAESNGGHSHSVNALLWMPQWQELISAGDDRVIRVWKIEAQ